MDSFSGRTVVVTGASSGIGRALAIQLADRGASLIILGRSVEKLEEVRAVTSALPICCDFERLSDVRRAAKEVADATTHLDLLINNAGVFYPHFLLTEDGNERTLQVNALAPYLLTRLLISRMRVAERPRTLFTSSEMHRIGRPRLHNLNSPEYFNGNEFRQGTYSDSKLFSTTLTTAFARRFPDIEFANVHPGTVRTSISRNMPIISILQRTPLRHFLSISPEESAASLLKAAETSQHLHGDYFKRTRRTNAAKLTREPALASQFWATAAELTGMKI